MTEKEEKSAGRYKKGTVLLTEKPFVFILKGKLRAERCDYCFSRCKLMKCNGCLFAYYCDRQCQKKGWFYHKKECPNIRKVSPAIVPDAARMMARIIIRLEKGGADERSFYTKTKSRVFKDLMSHYKEIKNDPKRMEHFHSLVVVLENYLGKDFLPNTAELLASYGRMVINSFNILDDEMQSIGTGIYLAASVIDHSCTPNAVATFSGTTISIRTIKNLQSINFSDIYISYIDLLNLPLKRQEELQNMYYFLCQCGRCTDLEQLKNMTCIICPEKSCRNAIPGGLSVAEPSCKKCGTPVSKEKLEEMNEVVDFTEKQLDNMKDVAYLDVCRMCLSKQENLLHPMNIYNVKILDMAFESCIAMENWEAAFMYGIKAKDFLRSYYGECHPLFGMFLMKLGKIGIFLEKFNESQKLIYEAANILTVTHGTCHPLVRNELRALLKDCSV